MRSLTSLPLRTLFLADAAACGAMGLLLLSGTSPLAPALGLPGALLRGSGAFLVALAAFLVWLAGRVAQPSAAVRALAWTVVVGNALWAVASVILVVDMSLTAAGVAFVLAQAAATAVFTVLEGMALPSARSSSSARSRAVRSC